jgi:hypothetical protein
MADSATKYPKSEYQAGHACTVLQNKRSTDKVIEHPRDKPGNIIIIHGVNDVGTSFNEVEEGLCAGLERRLSRHFKPAKYKMPTDKNEVVDDPDAVYFKRKVTSDTDSPLIPFYWGFRELEKKQRPSTARRPTATAIASTRTCPRAAARSAMPPAACPTCGTAVSAHRWMSCMTHCGHSRTAPAACTWCSLRSAWRP